MKFCKRIISIVLICLMLISTLTALPFSASAAGTSKTVDEAMAWVQSMLGQSIDADGAYGAQCVDLILSYYDFLGVPRSSGHGKDYATNRVPDGFTRIQGATPQRGDILVYSGTYGHVAIFESTYVTYHQMYYSHPYVEKVTNVAYNGFNTTPYWGVIRPNFSSGVTDPFQGKTVANLGDNFYATILKGDTGVYLTQQAHNVQIADPAKLSGNNHIWNFVRQSDGSYVIYNCDNGEVLDVQDAKTEPGTNIQTFTYWGGDAQKWFIYDNGGGQYFFRPKLCPLALDVANNSSNHGNNIIIYTLNNSVAQLFKIEKKPAVAASKLTVNAGDYATNTEFLFETNGDVKHHNLYIYSVSDGKLTEYDTYTYVNNKSTEVRLPAGDYEAYAESSNGYSTAKSNRVSFRVTAAPIVGDDGWIYCERLYDSITPDRYDIQYLNTYDKVAASSPGEGWVKGDLAKTEYVASGETYWSNIELPTSDTRVLVNYIYYHYCNASKGTEVNYEQTGTFAHYDWLPKTGVIEHSVANDYADARYKFYHLKWSNGGDAYCSSGTSCDGAHGTHGARSYYWYKSSEYQDRVAVNYYHYTKDAQWQSAADPEATATTYRYKYKDDVLTNPVEPDTTPTTAPITVPDTDPLESSTAPTIPVVTQPESNPVVIKPTTQPQSDPIVVKPTTQPDSKPASIPVAPSGKMGMEAEIANQETGDILFTYSGVKNAYYYELTFYDFSGDELYTKSSETTEYTWTPEDNFYGYVKVTAKDNKGKTLEESNLYSYILMDNEIQLAGSYGDADENFKINIKDATAVQKHLANIIKLSDFAVRLADVNSDDKTNIKDATTIQKHLANLKPKSRIGEMLTDSYVQQEIFLTEQTDSTDSTVSTDFTDPTESIPATSTEITEPVKPTIAIPTETTEATVATEATDGTNGDDLTADFLEIYTSEGNFRAIKVGEKITYSLELCAEEELNSVQAFLKFDPLKLRACSVSCDNLKDEFAAPIINVTDEGYIYFNASSAQSAFDFTEVKPLISVEFEATDSGKTEIYHEIEIMHTLYTDEYYFNNSQPQITEGITLTPVFKGENELSVTAGNASFGGKVGDTFTYYLELEADKHFEDIQGKITYDSSKLKLIKQQTQAAYCPILSKQVNSMTDYITNDSLTNEFRFIGNEIIDGFDFTEKRTLVMLEFEILAEGSTTINHTIEEMSVFGGEQRYFTNSQQIITEGISLTTSFE